MITIECYQRVVPLVMQVESVIALVKHVDKYFIYFVILYLNFRVYQRPPQSSGMSSINLTKARHPVKGTTSYSMLMSLIQIPGQMGLVGVIGLMFLSLCLFLRV